MRLGGWELTREGSRRGRRRYGARRRTTGRPARRRRTTAPWRRQAVKSGVALVAIGGAVGLVGHLWSIGWFGEQIDRVQGGVAGLARSAGFSVQEVLVEGRDRTASDALVAALGIERGTAIFGFDPEAARQNIEALAWVRQASVARRLPDTVYVQIDEHRPLALWQSDGNVAILDTEGLIIPDTRVERFRHLPTVVGATAPELAPDFLRLLATYPAVAEQMEAAVLVSGRRWNLRLKGSIEVKLPEQQVAQALQTLTSLDKEQALFERDLVAVDLRLPNQLILQRAPARSDHAPASNQPAGTPKPRLAGSAT